MSTNILQLPVVILGITVNTNADWLDGIEYHDNAGNPIDLAGITFEMEMRAEPEFATVVLRAATDNGLIRVYAQTWQLLVPASVMTLILPGNYVFDMLAHGDGYTRNLVQASVEVDLGITRIVAPPPSVSPGARSTASASSRRVRIGV